MVEWPFLEITENLFELQKWNVACELFVFIKCEASKRFSGLMKWQFIPNIWTK